MTARMDTGCDFGQDYLPSEGAGDGVLLTHLRNCADCQEQVVVVGADSAWSVALAE